MFTNPFPNAFGLDLGDLSVKLVQLRNRSIWHREPCYDLVNFRSISLPHGLIANGELQKPEEVRKKIQSLLHGRNKKEKPIICPKCKSPYWKNPKKLFRKGDKKNGKN